MGLELNDLTSEEKSILAAEILKDVGLSLAITVEAIRELLSLGDENWEHLLGISILTIEALRNCPHKEKEKCICKRRANIQESVFEWVGALRDIEKMKGKSSD